MSSSVQSLTQSLICVSEKENERLRNRSPKEILEDHIKALEQELALSKARLIEEFQEPEPVPPEDPAIKKLQEQVNMLESFLLNYIHEESTTKHDYNYHNHMKHYVAKYKDKRGFKDQRKFIFTSPIYNWNRSFGCSGHANDKIKIECNPVSYCFEVKYTKDDYQVGALLASIAFKRLNMQFEKDKKYTFIFTFTKDNFTLSTSEVEGDSFGYGSLFQGKGLYLTGLSNSHNLEEIFE